MQTLTGPNRLRIAILLQSRDYAVYINLETGVVRVRLLTN